MTSAQFHSFESLPGVQDPETAAAARTRIMDRHVLASLRAARGKTLSDLAEHRGVTKAAIHQLENRPLSKVSVGSLVGYLQALDYDVDEDWVARSLTEALPEPTP